MHKNKQWKNGKQQFWAEYGLISILALAEGCRNLAVTAVNWGPSSGTKPELSPQPHTRFPGVDHGWWWAPCSPPLNPTKPQLSFIWLRMSKTQWWLYQTWLFTYWDQRQPSSLRSDLFVVVVVVVWPCSMWDLPQPGMEPMSPTLAGGP